jgi:hypothetical protein
MTGAAYLADVSRTIGTKSIDMGGTVRENSDSKVSPVYLPRQESSNWSVKEDR